MFFDKILQIINESDVNKKFLNFKEFYADFKSNKNINFSRKTKANELVAPCYAKFCNVVSMRNLNKKIPKEQKQLHFIHSVAHIEFSAIDIALDECYRFSDMPREYYEDWLEVTDDEIRHFLMIQELLKEQGGYYGMFDVHDGLFVALVKTQDSLVKRMALLPRYMEANGLDANAHIITKLKAQNDNPKLIKALEIILDEEVSHVKKGDRWYKYACKCEGVDDKEYIKIIQTLYPNSFKTARELNETDRLKAGFSKDEILMIKQIAKI